MKYIIMCGGNYKDKFETPKQLLEVNGEKLVERTIRLLKENGIKDIAISTSNPAFDYIDVEKLRHNNNYLHNDEERHKKSEKSWLNAFYPTKEPVCYLFGDVYYSDNAIKTIVETEIKNTMFFCIRDIWDGRPAGLNIKGREPLAYKVQNQNVFRKAINDLFEMIDSGKFEMDPIAWNLYRKINGLQLAYNWYGNDIFNTDGDYMIIDDYSTDIDSIKDIERLEKFLSIERGFVKMVKVEVIENFHLGRFNELKNIIRKSIAEQGKLFVGDTFECTEEMYEYLTIKNAQHRAFVKMIEYIPEKVKEEKNKEVKQEEKPKAKKLTTKRKTIAKK